jgi:hypothetical protein
VRVVVDVASMEYVDVDNDVVHHAVAMENQD